MFGKRVKLTHVHEMHPMSVFEMIGEIGTIKDLDELITEKDGVESVTKVWLVAFDNGFRLWSRGKYLEVVND